MNDQVPRLYQFGAKRTRNERIAAQEILWTDQFLKNHCDPVLSSWQVDRTLVGLNEDEIAHVEDSLGDFDCQIETVAAGSARKK